MSFYNSFEEIFQEMKKRLTLTPTAMKLWIEPLKPLKLNNNHVMLYVESQFSKDMTMANFKTALSLAPHHVLASLVKGRWIDGKAQTVSLLRFTCDISVFFYLPNFSAVKTEGLLSYLTTIFHF